jgi:Mrp family chromosome partitioning ATPase
MVEDKPIFFDLLSAGEIPPNPSELLGSRRMEETLRLLASRYDFVLLDLPPVTAVSDALVATKVVDGVILVVRNEYSDTGSLNDAIRQIRQVDGKILGFVFTCADSGIGGYRKKYKYKYRYYNDYYE